jgi:branched-chain amino acid transport system ATP-binding protein
MSALRAEAICKSFGGVSALDGVSLALAPGTVHSVIGPNGAGKTTLLNALCGIYAPDAGRVFVGDRELAGAPSFEFARAGVGRSFQTPQIFLNMSALENVMAGRHLHERCGLAAALARPPSRARAERDCRERAAALMREVDLSRWLEADAGALPYGALKRLEIARALAAEPRVLLLDEPAAGLNARETLEIDELIRRIAARGIAVVLVEHNMRLVMGVSDRVLVLDYGKALAEGSAAEVRRDPRVIEAYLGAEGLAA